VDVTESFGVVGAAKTKSNVVLVVVSGVSMP